MKRFDAIVVGAGSGAKLASALVKRGMRVLLIEEDVLGGTCLNRGCIPSKMLIHTAELARDIRRASLFDLEVKEARCHFQKLVRRVNREVGSIAKNMAEGIEKNPRMQWVKGHAKFVDSKTLKVGRDLYRADRIYLATGAKPFIPPIPGLKGSPYLTSTEALRLETLPKRLSIIGSGYIAAELGFYFASLGSKVTVFTKGSFLRKEDPDIQKEFVRVFQSYVGLVDDPIDSVSYGKNGFVIRSKKRVLADQLLIASGTRGNRNDLGLEKTKVQIDEKGFIQVDPFLKTKEKGIWAFGDAIGPPFFRHKANFDAEYLLSFKKGRIRYPPIPYAIYSHPEIAGVGKSEEELKRGKVEYVSGVYKYKDTGRGMAILPEAGFVKLLFDRKTKKLLGARLIGVEAANLCHVLIALLQKKGRLQDLMDMIYIHPSLAEVIGSAALDAEKKFR